MKKILLALLAILFINEATAQVRGRVRLILKSVKCIQRSWEGFVDMDGHGNEISVSWRYKIFDPANPNAGRRNGNWTAVYGSNINGQTRAGTATPDLGGIKEGDEIRFDRLLLDEYMQANEILIFSPAVWEWDKQSERIVFDNFQIFTDRHLDTLSLTPNPFAKQDPYTYEDFSTRGFNAFDRFRFNGTYYHPLFAKAYCPNKTDANKIIGASSGTFQGQCVTSYSPKLIYLDTKMMNRVVGNNLAAADRNRRDRPSTFNGWTLDYIENAYAIETSNGKYQVTIHMDFIPDPEPVKSNAPVPLNREIKNPPPQTQNLQLNTVRTNTLMPMVGNWRGQITTDADGRQQSYGFDLTASNELLVKNEYGNIICQGTYSYSNNRINGSYKLLSTNQVFSFTGTFDGTTLTGTTGYNNNSSGFGRWTLSK